MIDLIIAGLLVVVIICVLLGLSILNNMDKNIQNLIKGLNAWMRKKGNT